MLLSSGIIDLVEERRRRGFITTLLKIRAHTNIWGNDLADAAATMAVTQYDSLPESHKLKVDVGEVATRPPLWVMYTVSLPTDPTHMRACTRAATPRQPWWLMSERERLQMHAFTRPSQQLRRKVRHAFLRNLDYTSLNRRLILKNIEVGANTQSVGKVIHRRLMANAWEGTALLKCIYGQLHNGKLAHRYGHAPTDECPLCHKPDSCTHIAGKCSFHMALAISRHNAACHLVHVAIRKSAKGRGALHSASDLVLVIADAGSHPQTS